MPSLFLFLFVMGLVDFPITKKNGSTLWTFPTYKLPKFGHSQDTIGMAIAI
jgi:hypothetical protein